MMNHLKKMWMLVAALLVMGAAAVLYAPGELEAAGSSFRFNNAFVGIQARLLAAVFNTTTGHDHDGVTSKLITVVSPMSSLTVTGTLVAGGTIVAPAGPFQVVGPAAQTIAAGNTVAANACGSVKRITAAGAVATDTTNTFTAPAAANAYCCMDVVNVGANAITLDNNALFFSAGAADVVLGAADSVRVCSSGAAGAWYQIGGTGNN